MVKDRVVDIARETERSTENKGSEAKEEKGMHREWGKQDHVTRKGSKKAGRSGVKAKGRIG